MINLELQRLNYESILLEYLLKKDNVDHFSKIISKIISKTNYTELSKKTININYNSMGDFSLKDQLKFIINNTSKTNIFLTSSTTSKTLLYSKSILDTYSDKKNNTISLDNLILDLSFNSTYILSNNKVVNYFICTDVESVQPPCLKTLSLFSIYKILNLVIQEKAKIISESNISIYWPRSHNLGGYIRTVNKINSIKNFSDITIPINNVPRAAITKSVKKGFINNLEPTDDYTNSNKYVGQSFTFIVKPMDICPSMLHVYLNHGGGGNDVMDAISKALSTSVSFAEEFEGHTEGIPIVWGILRNSKEIIDSALRNDQYFYYVDHAYFERGHKKSYRITRDRFEAGPIKKCPSDRLEKLSIKIKPWQKDGSKIIICPPTEYFNTAHQTYNWLAETINTISARTSRKIVIRHKPKPGEKNIPFEDQLLDAHALVTHSSNVAIESVIAGVPVFVSETSAASPVGLTDFSRIENPIYPDRRPWLKNLAYSQFSFNEIKNGSFFDILRSYEDLQFI